MRPDITSGLATAKPSERPAPSIEPLHRDRRADAAAVLARAYETNPLHARAFGAAVRGCNLAFFTQALDVLRGPTLAALAAGRVVGLVHWAEAPDCQLPPRQRLRLLPAMLRSFGVASTAHVARWLSTWAAHDLDEPHVHLGPIGVEPAAQGLGVGRGLMERFCAAQDARGLPGYLETDRPENVAFYRRFGFDVLAELPVLGVPTWRMRRDVAPHAGGLA